MKKILFVLLSLLLSVSAFAEIPENNSDQMTVEEFEASLKYRHGTILLPNGTATLQIPENFSYLDPEDSQRVLVDAWGNPPGQETLGMIFPVGQSLFDENTWGVIITYEEDGYVSDKDANNIKYDDLLKQMQKSGAAANKERVKLGYETVELVGWATAPFYEKEAKKMYWAKELKFGEDPEHTLNYNTRILGRKGVLNLNAVSGMNQLLQIEEDMQQVLDFTNFNEGFRYEDYDPTKDKAASYGIAALVAGGLAAKSGLLAKLGALLIAFKKFIIVAVIGIGALLKKLFSHNES